MVVPYTYYESTRPLDHYEEIAPMPFEEQIRPWSLKVLRDLIFIFRSSQED